ncbi:hypothetical protein [Sorangium sp. So ce1389]|uniref:hypothetical protein n=1 Tax=Sorangium sp. So ce1389 TaxID=3133336 RepID=UPI003F5DF29E
MSYRIHRYLGFAAITAGLFAPWGLGCVAGAEPEGEATAQDEELESTPEEVGEAEAAASDCSVCQYRTCDVTGASSCVKYYYWYHTCPGLPTGWGGKCRTEFYSCDGSCP